MNIYLFENYRKYLQMCLTSRKARDPSFSYRRFAELAGVKNHGFLHDVITGKRNLSNNLMEKSIEIFGLPEVHAHYFRLMVAHNHATDPMKKKELYARMKKRRAYSNFYKLNPGQLSYYDDTIYPLLIAALESTECRGDWDTLGGRIDPPVSAAKVEKCVGELIQWRLVEQDKAGIYRVRKKFIRPPEGLEVLVRNFNGEWLDKAREALERVAPHNRHISTVLLSVSKETRDYIHDKIERFRSEIFDLVEKDTHASEVMQLSVAYLPHLREEKDD